MNDELIEPIDFGARIVVNPRVLGGMPVVKDTRIPVSLILNLLAYGYTVERVAEAYPILTVADVRAALAYASARLEQADVGSLRRPRVRRSSSTRTSPPRPRRSFARRLA